MKMKTFRAATMRAAMAQVKATLGRDAVIMSSRELGSGRVELVAALDPEPTPTRVERSPQQAIEDQWFVPDPELVANLYAELKEMRQELTLLRAERSSLVTREHEWQSLMTELKALGHAMGVSGRTGDRGDALFARLLGGGVEVGLARYLADQAREVASDTARQTAAVAAGLRKAFRPAPAIWDRQAHAVAAFVGPTGVGKTTTLAKVAANAALQRGLDVALVAADTFRIGAVEQVQTYAQLLNLPCAVADGPKQLAEALGRFKRADLVLVDTAGGNPWDDATLTRTDALLRGLPIERHLCVTAGTGGDDAANIVRRYRQSGVRSLVVTKLDEARSVGGMISAVWGTDLQIAHVTTGQQVPTDIENPDPASLTQAVLG